METIKFITFTDVHLSVVNPSARIGNYEEDIFDKLNQIRKLGEKTKVDFFLFAGDLFNLKAPMRNPHELNGKIIQLFKSFPAPIYATEGNHDLRNDSYETFAEQPLYVIYASGALTQARDTRINVRGVRVRVRSFPFKEEPELSTYPVSKKDESDLSICLMHLYSAPQPQDNFMKIYGYDEIATLGDDVFVLGHYHVDQGIEILEKSGYKQVFVNVGSISRGSLTNEEVNRTPRIGYIECTVDEKGNTYKCQAGKLRVKPAEEVFNIVQREEEKKQHKEAEVFVAKLEQEIAVAPEGDDKIKSEVTALNIEKEVMEKVMEFLQEADLCRKSLEG